MTAIMPTGISALFIATTLAAIIWFHAAARSRAFLIGMLAWAGLQSTIGLSGFYQDATSLPPRIVLTGVLPTLLFIIGCFLTPRGRRFIDGMDLRTLTWLHTIRIPVEIVLWLLVERKLLSEYMSIGGTNFDVLSGITAPIVAYLAFRSTTNRTLLLYWNIACTILLFNVVVTAALGIPSPIQQHSFDQPNIAVLHFPFNLLPTVVVPLVLFAHLVAFRRLRK
jgi:hypothetical protein